MTPLFIHSAVLAYALGDEHPRRAACRAIVSAAQRGEVELHASVELVQELVFHRLRRSGRDGAVEEGRFAARLCALHPFDVPVLERSLDLTAMTRIGGRDAVHAATALLSGFATIVSPDRDFDGIPGLGRIDPSDALTR